MATPGQKLAESLKILKEIQDKGIIAIRTSALSRVHRERLVKNNFIREVIKGWYLSVPSDELPGDSTTWYTSFWPFCAEFLTARYGDAYCLSADQSLQVHSGNWTVPKQLMVRSSLGPNGKTPFPFNTSLFTIKSALPTIAEVQTVNGIRVLTLPSSLIHCSPLLFTKNPTDTRTALSMIRDSSEILGLLLEGGHSTIAGRLAGAFRNMGKIKIADDIIKTMQSAGYTVKESDPFETASPLIFDHRVISPYVNRLNMMWHQMREVVLDNFPASPGIPEDHEKYMKQVEELYVTDAYHSLSIEKYSVTAELINRVRSGEWDIENNENDKKQRDAMAARGYWQATQQVRKSILRILNHENPGAVVEKDHGDWYRELFEPSVSAGILKPSDLAGYRNSQVYISQSIHVPLNVKAVRDTMPVFFELLTEESKPSVRAVLGHFMFVYIHPYMDGNGRMARFLMNTMFASGGYPWTVIPVEERKVYMEVLEKASVEQNIEPFTNYLAYLMNAGLNGLPIAGMQNH